MKLIAKDYKRYFVKAKIDSLDDLWYLTYVIEKGDSLKAFTYRKLKIGGGDDRNAKVIKKPAVITINVEKIEFAKYSNILKVSGTISEAPEDMPLGSHHTISLEENSEFALQKSHFLKYQIEKLEESVDDNSGNILICVHDREEAFFAMLKKYGYEQLSHLKGNVSKKAEDKQETGDFFENIKDAILSYDAKYSLSGIVIASPGFWKEYMQKKTDGLTIRGKITYATCSSVGTNGINEVVRRPEVQTVLKQEKFAKETDKVEELLKEISLGGKAEYGLANISKIIGTGAISELLVTDSLIQKKRQENAFEEIEEMMRKVEKMDGVINIISSEHDGGKKLDGLGGIAALLRYRLNY